MLERKQLGHYRLIQRIGGGGMGEIYLAQDTRIERQVALKVVRAEVDPYPDAVSTAEMQRLFLREMQAITRLDHPHILPLYDFGEERDGNHIVTYMVMPYRPEGSLNDWLQKRGSVVRLSFQDVAYFVAQAAEALQHAHDHSLIHQDVKTSNFLVRDHPGLPLPDLLLSDFGIARVMSATSTASQSVRGTPTSMAPEQWQGRPELATDQYALAIMAYVLLAGRPPFTGRMEQLLHQHLSIQPVAPSTFNSAIPADLDTVILTALAKESSRRFGSVTAFARAFQQAAAVPGLALPFAGNASTPAPLQGALSQQPPVPPAGLPAYSSPNYGASLPPAPPFAAPNSGMPPQVAPWPGSGASAPQWPVVPPATPYPLAHSSPALPAATPSSPYIAQGNSAPYLPTLPPAAQVAPYYPPQSAVVLPPTLEQPPAPYAPPPPQAVYQSYPQFSYPQTGASQPGSMGPGENAQTLRSRRLLWALVAGCIIVVLIVSGVIGVNVYQNHTSDLNTASTANAQSTSAAQNTAIAQGTLVVQSTATAIAGQATASAQGTANAQASATAQIMANNPYPSYMSGSGTLTLIDSLQGAGHWQSASNSSFGGSCQFSNGALHISQTKANSFYYCEDDTSFSNFAVEVEMTIIRGDCGGVVIRATGNKMYYFSVCSTGTYSVWKYVDNNGSNASELKSGSSGINANSTNKVGIVANGGSITLYVNQQSVTSINDGSYASGYIAFSAEDTTNSTEVTYANARVWV